MNEQIVNEISKCVQTLREGGFIIFPNEIGWCIGCYLTDTENVNKLAAGDYEFGSVLLEDEGKLGKYVKVLPDTIWDLIQFSTKPMILWLQGAVNLSPALISESGEAAFRIPKDEFTNVLLHKAGKPIYTALLPNQEQPAKTTSILNKPGFVVNLRLSQKANTDELVVMSLTPSGQISFLKK